MPTKAGQSITITLPKLHGTANPGGWNPLVA